MLSSSGRYSSRAFIISAILGAIKFASDILLSQNVDLDKAMDIHAVDTLKDSFGTYICRKAVLVLSSNKPLIPT